MIHTISAILQLCRNGLKEMPSTKQSIYSFAFHHKQYEKFLGYKVSQTAFRRIRRLLETNQLSITKENLELIAKLKHEANNHNLKLELILSTFLKLLPTKGEITGKALYLHLEKATNYKPHRTTIQRWIPDYKPTNQYNSYQVSLAIVHALSYNLRSKKHDIRTQSIRISTLSA